MFKEELKNLKGSEQRYERKERIEGRFQVGREKLLVHQAAK